MKSTLLDMANTEPVDISNMPYDIKKRLSNDANNQFRINVYSNFNTWEQYDDMQFFMNQLVMINNQIVGLLLMKDVFIKKINSFGYDELILFALCFFVLMIFYSKNKNYIFFNMLSFIIGSIWFFGVLVLLQQDLNIVNVCIFPVILIISLNNCFQIFENFIDGNKLIDLNLTFKSNIYSLLLVFMIFFPLSFSIHSSFSSIPIIIFYGLLCYLVANILIYGLFCIKTMK